jgi:hypothetical protein
MNYTGDAVANGLLEAEQSTNQEKGDYSRPIIGGYWFSTQHTTLPVLAAAFRSFAVFETKPRGPLCSTRVSDDLHHFSSVFRPQRRLQNFQPLKKGVQLLFLQEAYLVALHVLFHQ